MHRQREKSQVQAMVFVQASRAKGAEVAVGGAHAEAMNADEPRARLGMTDRPIVRDPIRRVREPSFSTREARMRLEGALDGEVFAGEPRDSESFAFDAFDHMADNAECNDCGEFGYLLGPVDASVDLSTAAGERVFISLEANALFFIGVERHTLLVDNAAP